MARPSYGHRPPFYPTTTSERGVDVGMLRDTPQASLPGEPDSEGAHVAPSHFTPEDAARAADLDALDALCAARERNAWLEAWEDVERLAERLAVADHRGLPEWRLDPREGE